MNDGCSKLVAQVHQFEGAAQRTSLHRHRHSVILHVNQTRGFSCLAKTASVAPYLTHAQCSAAVQHSIVLCGAKNCGLTGWEPIKDSSFHRFLCEAPHTKSDMGGG